MLSAKENLTSSWQGRLIVLLTMGFILIEHGFGFTVRSMSMWRRLVKMLMKVSSIDSFITLLGGQNIKHNLPSDFSNSGRCES